MTKRIFSFILILSLTLALLPLTAFAVPAPELPRTFAFIYGEDARYFEEDTICIHNGEEILISFDLTEYPDFVLCDQNYDALKEAGFEVDDEIISFEDPGFKYRRIRANGLEVGTSASISYVWYPFDDYFGSKTHPMLEGSATIRVIDEKKGFILGDADGEGKVTIIDATTVQKYLASLPVQYIHKAAADATRNGVIDILDATFIQKSLAHLPVREAVGEEGVYGTYYASWNIEENLLPEGSTLEGKEAEEAIADIRLALDRLVDRKAMLSAVKLDRRAASSFVSDWVTDADGGEFYYNADSGDYYGFFDVDGYDPGPYLAKLKTYYDFDEETGKFTNVPALTYIYNPGEMHELIAEYLKETYKGFGIELELECVDWNEYQDRIAAGEYSMMRSGWVVDFDDPLEFLSMWTSNSEDNSVGFGRGSHKDLAVYNLDLTPYGYDKVIVNGTWTETYDYLISMIRQNRNQEHRYAMLHLAERMLMNTGCINPLYYY